MQVHWADLVERENALKRQKIGFHIGGSWNQELPELYSASRDKSVSFFEGSTSKTFLKELGSPYEIILSDKEGMIAIEWGAYGVPESFLIYKKKIIKKIIGPLNEKEFLEIKKMIK